MGKAIQLKAASMAHADIRGAGGHGGATQGGNAVVLS